MTGNVPRTSPAAIDGFGDTGRKVVEVRQCFNKHVAPKLLKGLFMYRIAAVNATRNLLFPIAGNSTRSRLPCKPTRPPDPQHAATRRSLRPPTHPTHRIPLVFLVTKRRKQCPRNPPLSFQGAWSPRTTNLRRGARHPERVPCPPHDPIDLVSLERNQREMRHPLRHRVSYPQKGPSRVRCRTTTGPVPRISIFRAVLGLGCG